MSKHDCKTKRQQAEAVVHAWASRTRSFPEDQFLRHHGWAIHSRPRGSEALWEKNGKVFTQSEALAMHGWGRD